MCWVLLLLISISSQMLSKIWQIWKESYKYEWHKNIFIHHLRHSLFKQTGFHFFKLIVNYMAL
jgi:hypothetical protein